MTNLIIRNLKQYYEKTEKIYFIYKKMSIKINFSFLNVIIKYFYIIIIKKKVKI